METRNTLIRWLFGELIGDAFAVRQSMISSTTTTNDSDSGNRRNAAIEERKIPASKMI